MLHVRVALDQKEQKLLYLRTPQGFHEYYSKWRRRLLAFRLAAGWYKEPNVSIRSMLSGHYKIVEESVSEILPWLYIGKVETANNESFLITHKFTHVLNITNTVSPYLLIFIVLPYSLETTLYL